MEMTLGERIANLRTKHKLTQEQFAKKIGVTRASLAKYETDKSSPDFDTLKKIANYFGVTIDYLLGNEQTKQIEVIDIKEALESKTKIATWEGKELTPEQRKALTEIFAVIHNRLLEEKNSKMGKEIGAMTAV